MSRPVEPATAPQRPPAPPSLPKITLKADYVIWPAVLVVAFLGILCFWRFFWHFMAFGILGCAALVMVASAFAIVFIALPIWTWWMLRRRILIRRTVRDVLCLQCGHSLLGTAFDENGVGTCPECGRSVHAAWYAQLQVESLT